MTKVHNKYHNTAPVDAINIMRPSKWGNPFSIGKDGDRNQVIESFRAYVLSKPDYVLAIKRELKGKDLVCCCAPKACHGDVLFEIANEGKPYLPCTTEDLPTVLGQLEDWNAKQK